MSSDHDRQFDELIEFANGSKSAHNAGELKDSDFVDLDLDKAAEEASTKTGEGGDQRVSKPVADPSLKALHCELIFIQVALGREKDRETGAMDVLFALMQVSRLKHELALWLGRPASLIHEGDALWLMREKLREAVSLKPPGDQSQDDWYTYQLSNDSAPGILGVESWLTPLLNRVHGTGDWQQFLDDLASQGTERDSDFADWLEMNREPVTYRASRERGAQLRNRLRQTIKGQEAAIDELCNGYTQGVLRSASGPKGIFTLLGAPGTGKTLLAECFAQCLPEVEQEQYQILSFSMEQFNSERSNGLLFGIGSFYSEASLGQLTDAVRNIPKSIIIFDEIEKAHPEVVQSLLTILDRGEATDQTSNRTADFSQAFIFITTNLGSESLSSRGASGQKLGTSDPEAIKGILQRSQANPRGLAPEFLSRLAKGRFLVFEELAPPSLIEIYSSAWNDRVESQPVQVSLPPCTTSLAVLHLLTRIPDATARTAASAPEQDMVEFLDRTLEVSETLEGDRGEDQPSPEIEGVERVLSDLLIEYEIDDPVGLLMIDDDENTSRVIDKQISQIHLELHPSSKRFEVSSPNRTPEIILVDLLLDESEQSALRVSAFEQITSLRSLFPNVPILVFARDADRSAQHRNALRQALRFEGVTAAKEYASSDAEHFVNWVQGFVQKVRYARLFNAFLRRQKKLSFDWRGVPKKQSIVIQPHLVHSEHVVRGEDFGGVIGLGNVPDERLEDVVGNERAVRTIFQAVGWLRRPREIGKFGVEPPRGYLLEGPPGTGKTFLAKAVAGECGLPFFNVSGSELVNKHIGETGRLLRELFAKARQYAPSILFIDEIDAMAGSRSGAGSFDAAGVNALLTEMDGFSSRTHPVLVLAATNRPTSLDSALLRAGRFDEVITCDLPNKAARQEMIRRGISQLQLEANDEIVESLVMRTQGSSAADIDGLVREAIYHAVSEGRNPQEQDIEEACNRVVYGAIRTDLKLAREEKWGTACHEAGHALAVHFLMPSNCLDYLSIQPRSHSLGFVAYREDTDNPVSRLSMKVSEVRAQLIILLAGREAERQMLGADEMSTGATDDLRKANQLAMHAIQACGLDEVLGPVAPSDQAAASAYFRATVAERLQVWLVEAETRCSELLRRNHPILQHLAKALYEQESMEGDQFLNIMNAKLEYEPEVDKDRSS